MSERLDCLAVDCGRAPPVPAPAAHSYDGVDLQAKDYDSLLRAMLDQLQRRAPDWRDRSEADAGMVVLELFAYGGDQVSYLQDRVALEGFLRTATQAESVRKLLRLVDYEVDPGLAAEADLAFECTGIAPLFLARGFAVSTKGGADESPVVYETMEDVVLHPALGSIALSTDAPSSADGRTAILGANLSGALAPGAWLLFQQGSTREWAVVQQCVFAGGFTTITLERPLAARYSAVAQPALGLPAASAHGNRARATHGETHRAEQLGTGLAGQRVSLDHAPLTWVRGTTDDELVPERQVTVDGEPWVEVEDFIDSVASAPHFRMLRENDGFVTVEFGDLESGAAPAAGSHIAVTYRAGIGTPGHAARDTLAAFDDTLLFPHPSQRIVRVRNPLPASAPRNPQSLEQAKLLGPAQLRVQNRAVVDADYERILAGGVRVGGVRVKPLQSRARTRHTGSWNTVIVSVDMADRQPLASVPGLRAAFESRLDEVRMAGLDVRVEDARYCPLHIALLVEVERDHFARDVRRAVENALTGPRTDAIPFFGAGRFRFGQDVYLSDLYAVVTAVEGVTDVSVTRFKRLGDRYPDREAQGFIPVGALEVARCDNDPASTSNGILYVRTCGGKEG